MSNVICVCGMSKSESMLNFDTIYFRKWIQMSYKIYGSGSSSRNAQFVVWQCVHVLYALRCIFMVHCLDHVDHRNVHVPSRISQLYLNSQVESGFTAIQNIKRPGKSCIPDHHRQHVTWIGQGYDSLEVHTGPNGLGRVLVSHEIMKRIFDAIMKILVEEMEQMQVPQYTYSKFLLLRESASSSTKNEGMGVFNRSTWSQEFITRNTTSDRRVKFCKFASRMYQLVMVGIYLSGGPSPRGTEQAVTRLLNSDTELIRNVHLIDGTIGVQSG